jgi:cytidylate kinase
LKKIAIAIDGPAASGKSTTAKMVAQKLGYLHIDTGAMYRAITLKVLDERLDLSEKEKIVRVAQATRIRLYTENGTTKIFVDEQDVTRRLRTPLVTGAVSTVSCYPEVREVMVREQRKMAARGGAVLEGRDIGTVVLPHAELKIFMTANIRERARRRKKDLAATGIDTPLDNLEKEIEQRDRKDTLRESSPLKKAADAIELDTSDLTIQQQVDFIVKRALEIIRRAEKEG